MGEVVDFPTSSSEHIGHNWFMYHCVDCETPRTDETETQPCPVNDVDNWLQPEIEVRDEPVDAPGYEPSPGVYYPSLQPIQVRHGFFYVLGTAILGSLAAIVLFIILFAILLTILAAS